MGYVLGFAYALIVGTVLIKLVADRMEDIVNLALNRPTPSYEVMLRWQPVTMGLIERTLYMSSLLLGRGEFIAVWLGLKVAGGWKRWQENEGRYLYSRSLFWSGLSVLYALIGYLLIKGINSGKADYAVVGALILAIATWCLWFWLKRYTK